MRSSSIWYTQPIRDERPSRCLRRCQRRHPQLPQEPTIFWRQLLPRRLLDELGITSRRLMSESGPTPSVCSSASRTAASPSTHSGSRRYGGRRATTFAAYKRPSVTILASSGLPERLGGDHHANRSGLCCVQHSGAWVQDGAGWAGIASLRPDGFAAAASRKQGCLCMRPLAGTVPYRRRPPAGHLAEHRCEPRDTECPRSGHSVADVAPVGGVLLRSAAA